MTDRKRSNKNLFSMAVTLISAVVFGIITSCLMVSVPGSQKDEAIVPVDIYTDDALILAPQLQVEDTESEESAVETYQVLSIGAQALVFNAPEFSNPETASLPETTATVTAAVTTTPETIAATISAPAAVTAPQTEALQTEAPVVPLVNPNSGYLADKMGVLYTVEAPTFTMTDEELMMAATIVQLEVMGNGSSLYSFENTQEKYWEMLSVAQCIRNRVYHSKFPGTVKEVIFQSRTLANGRVIYQFSPAKNLHLYTPTEEAVTAAREVLVNGLTVVPNNYIYFCATRISESFEKNNAYVLAVDEYGYHDKIEGHQTTFYGTWQQ